MKKIVSIILVILIFLLLVFYKVVNSTNEIVMEIGAINTYNGKTTIIGSTQEDTKEIKTSAIVSFIVKDDTKILKNKNIIKKDKLKVRDKITVTYDDKNTEVTPIKLLNVSNIEIIK